MFRFEMERWFGSEMERWFGLRWRDGLARDGEMVWFEMERWFG